MIWKVVQSPHVFFRPSSSPFPLLILTDFSRVHKLRLFLLSSNPPPGNQTEMLMATVSRFNHFPCWTLSSKPNLSTNSPSPSILRLNSTRNTKNPTRNHQLFVREPGKATARPISEVRAAYDGQLTPQEEELAPAVAVAEEPPQEPTEVEKLKKTLIDSFYGTDRGLRASSETRAEIVELITQLEAKNPTPAPTEALPLLNGKWILAYTSFPGLFPLLSRGELLLVKVEEISQTIDTENFTVQNCVQFSGPLATNSITTNAKFEVRSPKRVQIKFEEGVIGTPQLTDSIVLPENFQVFGQNIDLSPFKGLITSVQDTASSVAKTFSSQPPLKIPLTDRNAESWLLTTFLDEELRISRGDAGSVFVLVKEGSSLLAP